MYYIILLLSVISLFSCANEKNTNKTDKLPAEDSVGNLVMDKNKIQKSIKMDSVLALPDSTWVDLKELLPKAKFDIRYADTNNFMKLKVYECPGCFTRLAVAKSVLKAQEKLDSMGLTFLFFDCFRPTLAQWKLWDKMPDARYVHPPSLGSRHSRGVALDLTLYDLKADTVLDMGAEFDHFGKESYWSYSGLSETAQKNRKLLLSIMTDHNFSTVLNEWWHFDYRVQKFSLSDMRWSCPEKQYK